MMSQFMARMTWIAVALAFILFVTQPIGLKLHFAFSIVALGLMILVSVLKLTGLFRHIFLALGSVIVVRYVYWRVTETVPSPSQPADFLPGVLLLIAELYCISMLALGLFVNAQPITRGRAPQQPDDELPTVDVFLPSYNEERDLVASTLAAIKGLDYPAEKLRVYLLDDGGTDEKVYSIDPSAAAAARQRRASMQQLCADLDVTYLTRERNLHAKAGNLNNGLAHSDGELVVVFDADHVPARDFLRETVGFFAGDRRLFLVQTPHFFINADPLERNLQTFKSMPSENEMFYGAIQKGLDSWNAAFFCGSAAVLRREALDEVGGFAGVTITEDCESALELHSRGWKSLYVEKPLIAGLQPETFESFIGQRSRWCRGMLQIFMLKNPLFKRGLSLPQKLCYASSNLFWLFPLSRLIFMISPLFFIVFNLEIYNASPQEFVAYTLTYIVAVMLIQNYLYGRLRWPWVSELYEYIQSVYLSGAIFSVLANPRAPKFNVTQKGNSLSDDGLSPLAWPFYAIFGILAAATAFTAWRYFEEPASRNLLLVVGIWNLFNTILAGLALGVVSERRERRKIQRLSANRSGELLVEGLRLPVQVLDASIGGLKVRLAGAQAQHLSPGRHRATIRVAGVRSKTVLQAQVAIATAVAGEGGRILGLSFVDSAPERYRLVADVAYADLTAVRDMRASRHVRRNLIAASVGTVLWGAREMLRGLYFLLFRRTSPVAPAPLAPPAPVDPVHTDEAVMPSVRPARKGLARLPKATGLGDIPRPTTA
ncbi:UDP-forming cellulose synthase catalytic subunit [Bosea sp. AAP35]|uniref:UDP-forming cellulose synthase catalytic subunit n=1 Tax=Bosea sp. AAP35 TaxID=1523417 RepID=UPI000A8A8DE7|nr:UDP-forming cellulose synthase catalytic subunit [Bosea sp. AAP35]